MKRLASIIALCALCCLAAGAQGKSVPHTPEIYIGVGGAPIMGGYLFHDNGSPWFDDPRDSPSNLDQVYDKKIGDSRTYGFASATIDVPILTWLSVPMTMTASVNATPVQGALDNDAKTVYDATLNFLAGARFKYVRKEHFNLYSSVQVGITVFNLGAPELSGTWKPDWFPAIQLVPIGIKAGGKVFFFGEIGVGTAWLGGQAGIGFSF